MSEHSHQQRQQKLKEKVDARIDAAQQEKGLFLIITGNGKGKSTSAFGTVARAAGHGFKCGVAQYLVVLDEITYMITYGYIDLDDVIATISQRPSEQSVLITGRGAHRRLVEMADTVSEVRNVKHAFDAGVKARQGIDW
ncbi:cob(I)yrinic acid a,c-diamide adenosyltransferase [Salinivibrio kushneri]|uniref:cob(I)yrinic acid a,c-diamide adenosyltransferase n=1 Tax=Salinivibrio kushneri TaxID=1908198 RepID=UPI000989783D|nr:cob(I)yrinic acid a,c-diamide adenosyltransferase [Salinivibrio kushneri]OOE50714.1 hypothetical protein BZG10_08265 [Salinivibrio kushneri]